jgi:translocation and assembly module TamA
LTAGEIGAEMRFRFGSFGVVPFVDAGIVSEELFSEFDTVRYGAGLGLRYYSPVGPIRLDVAVPFKARERDPAFQFYISIGQAF